MVIASDVLVGHSHAEPAERRLILVGDPEQLPATCFSGPLGKPVNEGLIASPFGECSHKYLYILVYACIYIYIHTHIHIHLEV